MVNSGTRLPQPPAGWGDDFNGGHDGAASPGVQMAQNVPFSVWPVPGHTELNPRDPQRGQGDGAFGTPRAFPFSC